MANANSPFGFRITRRLDGAAPNYAVVDRQIAYTNTNVIAKGDVVIELSDGTIDIATTSSNPILGIFDGVRYYDTVLKSTVWAQEWAAPTTALTGTVFAKINIDKMAVFEVQASAANIALASVGLNSNLVVGTPTIAGLSTQALNSTTTTTNTQPFRIVGIQGAPITDSTGSYNIVEVVMNTQTYFQTTGV